ncbi:MAG: esterase family protein [Bacteroidales bacterium]|nr:esterase family protein [Bacteroidales bacterium]
MRNNPILILLGLLIIVPTFVWAQGHSINSCGSISRIDAFPSKYVTARNIDVWLPTGYTASKKYSVLYMHDGQMLYDSATTWNHLAWDVDDVLDALMKEGKIKDVIVVGIWNGDKTRHADYFPQKPFESLSKDKREQVFAAARSNGYSVFNNYEIQSDNYLKFIVQEVKPKIDSGFSTYTDRKHTFIAGSSMGGLISMYAICEYPEVFGGAACLSTHWPGVFSMDNNPIPEAFYEYLRKNLPNPKTHRIYFDYGDQTLDAMYPPLQREVDAIMEEKGFTPESWETRYFPGENHSETAWHKRFAVVATFLLHK